MQQGNNSINSESQNCHCQQYFCQFWTQLYAIYFCWFQRYTTNNRKIYLKITYSFSTKYLPTKEVSKERTYHSLSAVLILAISILSKSRNQQIWVAIQIASTTSGLVGRCNIIETPRIDHYTSFNHSVWQINKTTLLYLCKYKNNLLKPISCIIKFKINCTRFTQMKLGGTCFFVGNFVLLLRCNWQIVLDKVSKHVEICVNRV